MSNEKNACDDKVAVILVNYNGEEDLDRCLSSIYGQTYKNIEVYIVDNASTDNSVSITKKDYPKVKWILSETNVGWGEGSNMGMCAAMEEGAAYMLLLNTDTEIDEDMVEILLKYADEKTVVAPRMYRMGENGDQIPWYAGGRIDFERGDVEQRLYPEPGDEDTTYEVSFITGCCMMIHSHIIKKIGLFDPAYFMYLEDVDLCVRLRENRIKMLYIPRTGLWHKVGSSGGGEVSYISQYYTVRNRLYFAEKHARSMKCECIDVLRDVLAGRAYFEAPDTIRFKPFVLAGIRDFLQKKMGKEHSMIYDNAYFIEGFYAKEEDAYNVWNWANEKKVRIEIANSSGYRRRLTVSCLIGPPPGKTSRNVQVFLENELIEEVKAPDKLKAEIVLEANEMKSLYLKTREKLVEMDNGDPRKFAFQVLNFSVR